MTKTTRLTPNAPLYVTPPPKGAHFDADSVERVCAALRALRHTKGRWAGSPLELEPWQLEYIIKPIFGWRRDGGTRAVRTAWVEVPRKNGKSTLAAGLALILLCADGEAGAEVYSAAAGTDQARIVFDEARRMVQRSPRLRKKLRVTARAIHAAASGSQYRVLSRVAETAHGLNVHGAVVDEIHVHRSRDLIDAIETGTGARQQPLVLFLTTADEGATGSIYAEKHEYVRKVASGTVEDPTFYGAVWAAEDDDDPFSEDTWYKANPNLGVSVSLDYLKQEAARAKEVPSYFPTFCRLLLNRRMRSDSVWLPISDWDACAGAVTVERGALCYGGLDLASTTDIAAFVLAFPTDDGVKVMPHFWIPGDNLTERIRTDKVPYDVWASAGLLEATPGNVIDYSAIRRKIKALAEQYRISEIAYDRWGATQLVQELQDDGATVVPIGQGYASMSAPTKELIRRVKGRELAHGGNPVLRYMAANLTTVADAAGNLKPARDKSTARIDGMVALIMAMDRLMRHADTRSVYEERGMLAL